MKNILITGGAGFVGSHLALAVKKNFPKANVISLDNLIRRGSELNIPRLKAGGIKFVRGDVRSKKDLSFKDTKISLIIECSAEPSVLAGLNGSPQYVVDTNLFGLVNCLELARLHQAGMIFLSTSRVYPIEKLRHLKLKKGKTRFSLEARQPFVGVSQKGIAEHFPLDGWRSIYGATKLAAEMLIEEYVHTYHLNAVINRCGVIAGPWQMGKVDQGIFTFWLLHHYFKKPLNYIGYGGQGKQVRDLLHIDDLSRLILMQMNHMKKFSGRTYNVGGGEKISLSLRETTDICRQLTGHTVPVKSVAKNRQADIPLYISDCSKIRKEAGWKPEKSAREILSDIYWWMKFNESVVKKALLS